MQPLRSWSLWRVLGLATAWLVLYLSGCMVYMHRQISETARHHAAGQDYIETVAIPGGLTLSLGPILVLAVVWAYARWWRSTG